MIRVMLVGLAKLIFLFAPSVGGVFTLLYFFDVYLINRDLKQFLFIPTVASLAICFFLFRLILGPTMTKIKELQITKKTD